MPQPNFKEKLNSHTEQRECERRYKSNLCMVWNFDTAAWCDRKAISTLKVPSTGATMKVCGPCLNDYRSNNY